MANITVKPYVEDSGANPFDQFDAAPGAAGASPPASAEANPFDQFDGPKVSTTDAAVTGLKSGLTAGFADELTGAKDAGLVGLPSDVTSNLHLSPLGKLLAAAGGGVRIGIENLFGGDDATKAYQAGRDRVRAIQKAAREQHPIATGAGEVAGALATIPIAPGLSVAKGGGVAARIANAVANGATYGGLFGAGEGEGAEDTLRRAESGALVGGVGGGVAAPVAEIGGNGFSLLAKPFKAAVSPDKEAARRVAGAFEADRPGTTLHNVADALDVTRRAGEPVVTADLGGETVRGVARSAANTSPAGREALQAATAPRFQEQGQRLADDVGWIIGGNAEAVGAKEAIRAAAAASNKANYAIAYREGAKPLWDEGFQQITAAPVVQDAIKAATRTGANKAAADGFRPPQNPFVFAADGTMTMKDGVHPTLQFWDHVKRNLDDKISSLLRSGEKSAAADAQKLRSYLVKHLDELVPSYSQARSEAAAAFGAEDAMTAGEQFLTAHLGNEEARRALAKMTTEQRKSFSYGFASELLKTIREVPAKDRSTVVSKAFLNSPAAKERIEMALGPNGLRRIEARVRLENMMEQTRAAVSGNSTTARQLIEAGLAGSVSGGAYGVFSGDYNTAHLSAAAITGALMRAGYRQVDARIARRVGELLASDDPKVIRQAAEMVAKNPRLMDGVRRADALVTRTLAAVQPDASRLLPGPVAGRADEQQQPGK